MQKFSLAPFFFIIIIHNTKIPLLSPFLSFSLTTFTLGTQHWSSISNALCSPLVPHTFHYCYRHNISNPVISIVSPETETPLEPHLDSESPTNEISSETCAADKVEEFQVSKTLTEYDGIVGKFSARSVLKYCAYLVGILCFKHSVLYGYWEMPILRAKKGIG